MYKELFKATVERTGIGGAPIDLVDDSLVYIGDFAYSYHKMLGRIKLDNVVSCGRSPFERAAFGGDIEFPNLTTIGTYFAALAGFENSPYWSSGDGVITIKLPKVAVLSSSAFYGLTQLAGTSRPLYDVYLDQCTEIQGNCFYNCSGLRYLYAPNVTSIIGSTTFLLLGGTYPQRNPSVSMVVGSADGLTGMSMATLLAQQDFPFGYNSTGFGRVTWYCNDGTVRYDTTQGAWVQTPYS